MEEILEISQNATRWYELPYPMREIDEISIMARVFANTLALYLAFLEISQMYWPVAANIDIGWCP